jgi:hypothetical protein
VAATSPPQVADLSQSSPVAGTPFAYKLYTHCGIGFANISGTWFEADTPLSDGSGNPPKGWDNPEQRGVMRLLTASTAEFRDDNGHDVKFHVMPASQQPPACS